MYQLFISRPRLFVWLRLFIMLRPFISLRLFIWLRLPKPKFLRVVLFCVMGGLLSACGGGGTTKDEAKATAPVIIKFPHVTSPTTPKGKTAERFKSLVEERLAGKVVVEVFPSGQLMSDDDSLDALAFGEIQMIAVSLSKYDRLTKKFQLFDLPFLFSDLKTVEKYQASDDGKQLLDSLTDRGIKGVAFWHNGMKHFGAPIALRTPDDAAGLKFRIMESDVLQEQILTIGGNPQKMAFGEVYQALQTGAVDAQENTWSNIYSSKFYEVQKYLTKSNHGYLGYLVAVNTDFWNSLDEDVRAELGKIIAEVSAWGNAQAKQINQDALDKISAVGSSTIIELSDAERLVWQAKMRPVWDKFEENIGKEVIEAAVGANQE